MSDFTAKIHLIQFRLLLHPVLIQLTEIGTEKC